MSVVSPSFITAVPIWYNKWAGEDREYNYSNCVVQLCLVLTAVYEYKFIVRSNSCIQHRQQRISWCVDSCNCHLDPKTAPPDTTKDYFAHKRYADDEMGGA